MGSFLKKRVGFLLALILLIPLCQTGFARDDTDDLLLTGFVRSFDVTNGTITINVTSEGCAGLRQFRVPEYTKEDLDPSLINQRVQFHIKSATCERGRIYEMILER